MHRPRDASSIGCILQGTYGPRKKKNGTHQNGIVLEWKQVCRASMHSFFIDCQSLRELRITSVLIIAITQKRCGWDSSVTAPQFFLREEVLKIQHMRFPPSPTPRLPPASPPLLGSLPPSPPTPPAPLLLGGTSLALVLRQGCSLKRRVTRQI
jgi:hypothetical protein